MVTNFAITGNTEILQVAEAVARDKGIDKDSVFEAMEQAMQTIAKRKYGHELNIRAEIDKKTGQINLFREREVVSTIEDEDNHILEKDAKDIQKDAKEGEIISEPLPPLDFGRVTSQTAKQVIVQKIRDAERAKQFEDFKDRVGEIINGVVKRIEYGNVIVDFGRTETILPREETIPREAFRPNDRIRAYIVDVRRETKGPQIILSRTHPDFLAELFKQEVPEIYDGIITIHAVARDPGSRAKFAISSSDSTIDPVGACVGLRGSRVQAVVNELQGEKIDIIEWSPDTAKLVVNALAPAEVTKIVIDEENERIEVVVPEDQLSLAIGRRGQNVRLASNIVGCNIDVMTEEEESTRRTEEFNTVSSLFTEALNVEEIIAQLLVTEGFREVEELAAATTEELAGIEGFDADIAEELLARANSYLTEKAEELEKKSKELGIQKDLIELEGLSNDIVITLGENGVKSKEDFADLARDEFKEFVPNSGKTDKEIDQLIMLARAHWFEAEEGEKEESADTEDASKEEVSA